MGLVKYQQVTNEPRTLRKRYQKLYEDGDEINNEKNFLIYESTEASLGAHERPPR